MALCRTIQTSFWSDPKIEDDFTPEDKLFFVYLLTNSMTNFCGCYEISERRMSRELGLSKDSVKNLLERFSKYHNVIRYSDENKEILVLNWAKYHWTKSPKSEESVLNGIEQIKTEEFAEIVTGYFNEFYSGKAKTPKPKKEKNEIRHKFGEFGIVRLTEEEYKRILEKYGEPLTKEAIKILDEYCKGSGRRYADYNLTLRKWPMDEAKKKKGKASDYFEGMSFGEGKE